MTPATVADAYWMLRQAVEIPDPVIFWSTSSCTAG